MEAEVPPNIARIQPLPEVPVLPSKNWLKILSFTLLEVVVIAGSVFIGIQIGRNQIVNQQPITAQPTIIPSQTTTNSTTNPTSDWKTYTNSLYKFEFQYPPDWEMNKYAQGGSDSHKLSPEELNHFISFSKYTPDKSHGYSISVSVNNSQMGKPIFCSGSVTDPSCLSQFFDSQPEIKYQEYQIASLDQTPAIKYSDIADYTTIVFVKNKTLIEINYPPDPYQSMETLTDQILSTFKFIN